MLTSHLSPCSGCPKDFHGAFPEICRIINDATTNDKVSTEHPSDTSEILNSGNFLKASTELEVITPSDYVRDSSPEVRRSALQRKSPEWNGQRSEVSLCVLRMSSLIANAYAPTLSGECFFSAFIHGFCGGNGINGSPGSAVWCYLHFVKIQLSKTRNIKADLLRFAKPALVSLQHYKSV